MIDILLALKQFIRTSFSDFPIPYSLSPSSDNIYYMLWKFVCVCILTNILSLNLEVMNSPFKSI